MKVRFAPRAEADLEAIFSYLDARSPDGARNILRDIHAAVLMLAEHPAAAARTDEPGVRVRIAVRYHYKIFYRVRPEAIEVLHIRHRSRRPWTGE